MNIIDHICDTEVAFCVAHILFANQMYQMIGNHLLLSKKSISRTGACFGLLCRIENY